MLRFYYPRWQSCKAWSTDKDACFPFHISKFAQSNSDTLRHYSHRLMLIEVKKIPLYPLRRAIKRENAHVHCKNYGYRMDIKAHCNIGVWANLLLHRPQHLHTKEYHLHYCSPPAQKQSTMVKFTQSILILFAFLSVTTAEMQMQNGLPSDPTFRVVGDPNLYKYIKMLKRRATSADYSIGANTPLGQALRSSRAPVIADVRKFAREGVPGVKMTMNLTDFSEKPPATICPGPGVGSGMALAPMRFSFSPPGNPNCFLFPPAPITCLCQFGCGQFLGFKYCYYICNGTIQLIGSGVAGFSCNVRGIKLPSTPGMPPCPLPTNVALCSV